MVPAEARASAGCILGQVISDQRSGGKTRKSKAENREQNQDAMVVLRSLHYATAKGAVAPVGMTPCAWGRRGGARVTSRLGASGMTKQEEANPRPRHTLRAWGTRL